MDGKYLFCDCGTQLIYVKQVIVEKFTNITKDGKIGKKFKDCSGDIETGCSWLECVNCRREYDYDILANGRILRSDLR